MGSASRETPFPSPSKAFSVRRLGPETQQDFFRLRGHPGCDWCFCVAWHVPTWDGWTDRTAEENRALRNRLFAEGKFDGYLVYDGAQPIGWCQCAPLAWFPKLVEQFGLEQEPQGTYAVGCLEILPEHRKRGLSSILLREVLQDLKRQGVTRVLAVPRAGRHEDGKVWTGPASLFESAGFEPLRDVGDRKVVALSLACAP